jgi:hypothetical protein
LVHLCSVKVVDTVDWSLNHISIPHQLKICGLEFSPKENFLVVYQPYAGKRLILFKEIFI